MTAVAELPESVGTVAARAALGVSPATVYRKRAPKEKVPKRRATNPRALAAAERQQDGPSAARFNSSATLISGRRCLRVSDTIRAESWGHTSHAGRSLSVDKAFPGLCPLKRPRETPRVSRVAVGRIRRPVTFSTGC
jgi:hypothetical protein